MVIRALSRDEVRGLDRRAAEELGLPTLVLMENAGRGAAAIVRRRWPAPGRVVILCGPGNNGGDGGVVARHLDAAGYGVQVVWLADPGSLAPDAAVQHAILARSGIEQHARPDGAGLEEWLGAADVVVDGLLGTGLARPVEGAMRRAIEAVNAAHKPVLALDLPSGLDADSGRPLGLAVRAAGTATFVAPKLGFVQPEAADYLGVVEVVEIGLPRCLLRAYEREG